MSEAITTPTITERQISTFSDEYKKRRKQQMLRFFGATALTLISCRLAYRGVKSRKYVPNMFQLNYKSPPFSYQAEAASALVFGTGLAVGGFSMLVFGSCWLSDISSFPEFSLKAKQLMGQDPISDSKLTNMPLDDDTAKVVDQLERLLEGKNK
ncbi:uncharacterized protein TDEL_0C01660 [Torulaspora delbrueckii]|uniref:Altered inheritance of mitochondria protein 11 n=1 Tax=Torulaspora delbrueckii TaxID=4950 RepID=G8ZRB3_TORDE|nr:hypothetical protein TDEL_0C01660 [Torulaspora delbrueckii]CCE91055.1 hypothetical protein TDEL_0C01660 [Torulaspora delbrueckii]